MHGIDLERSWTFFGVDGVRYWNGCLRTGQVIEVLATSENIAAGEAVTNIITSSAWPRWDLAASAEPVKTALAGRRVQAATTQCFLGVALENIVLSKIGRVGGRGTMAAVKSLTVGSLTSNTLGAIATGSGTAGSIDGVAAANNNFHGRILGVVMCIAGTTGAGTDTGSLTQLGVDINPM